MPLFCCPSARWVRSGAAESLSRVLAWDADLRGRLAAASEGGATAEVEAVLESALRRCHPNHAVALQARSREKKTRREICRDWDEFRPRRGQTPPGSLQARLRLVQLASSDADRCRRAEQALSVAARVCGKYDEQLGDLYCTLSARRGL